MIEESSPIESTIDSSQPHRYHYVGGKLTGKKKTSRRDCIYDAAGRSQFVRRDSRNKSLMCRFRVDRPCDFEFKSQLELGRLMSTGRKGVSRLARCFSDRKERERESQETERESALILKITRRVRGPLERGLASIRISLACRLPGVAPFVFFFEFFPLNSSTVLRELFFRALHFHIAFCTEIPLLMFLKRYLLLIKFSFWYENYFIIDRIPFWYFYIAFIAYRNSFICQLINRNHLKQSNH